MPRSLIASPPADAPRGGRRLGDRPDYSRVYTLIELFEFADTFVRPLISTPASPSPAATRLAEAAVLAEALDPGAALLRARPGRRGSAAGLGLARRK